MMHMQYTMTPDIMLKQLTIAEALPDVRFCNAQALLTPTQEQPSTQVCVLVLYRQAGATGSVIGNLACLLLADSASGLQNM